MAVTMNSVMHTDVLSGLEASTIPLQHSYSADPPMCQQREAERAAVPETCRTDQPPRQREVKRVVIPDLFVSFVSQRPKLNPYYEVVKKESEAWMKQYETISFQFCRRRHAQRTSDTSVRICHWTEKEHAKHVRADFPYFAAVWTTEAGPDEFRTICDWSNWVGL